MDADEQWFWLVQFCGLLTSQRDVFIYLRNSPLLLVETLLKHKKNLRKHRVERMRNTFLSQL